MKDLTRRSFIQVIASATAAAAIALDMFRDPTPHYKEDKVEPIKQRFDIANSPFLLLLKQRAEEMDWGFEQTEICGHWE